LGLKALLRPSFSGAANQIYVNMPSRLGSLKLSKATPKFVPSQKYVGIQVIDSKGAVVGNVKDVSVDFRNKALAFHVETKARTEMDVAWDDVLSVEDVVLLKKEVDVAEPPAPSTPPPIVQAALICPNCGTSAPSHAKFCPKCGASLR
jgi:sporulation protein YlmC with PRC-barrel domain